MNTVAGNVVRNYVDWLQQHTEIETMEDGWERVTGHDHRFGHCGPLPDNERDCSTLQNTSLAGWNWMN